MGFIIAKNGTLTKYESEVGVDNVVIPDNVKKISKSAFKCITGIKSISIGANVKEIVVWGFIECSDLISINVSNENKYFSSRNGVLFNKDGSVLLFCPQGLEELVIPKGVKEIGDYAFSRDAKIRKVVIPDGVEIIGKDAFLRSGIVSMIMPNSVKSIGERCFIGCKSLSNIKLSSEIKEISEYALASCPSLKSIHLPDGLEQICNFAFSSCESLKDIDFPSSLRNISYCAFEGCNALQNIKFASTETVINEQAFPESIINRLKYIPPTSKNDCGYYLSTLKPEIQFEINDKGVLKKVTKESAYGSIVIPEGVKEIGNSAFSNCKNLKKITLPKSIVKIEKKSFYKCSSLFEIEFLGVPEEIGESAFESCRLTKILLPDGVKNICNNAFANNIAHVVTIPSSVGSIGDYAFLGCNDIRYLKISEGVKEIGEKAFFSCDWIENIILPRSLTKIGEKAFCYGNSVIDDKQEYVIQKTIYGHKGSLAEKYADANKLEFKPVKMVETIDATENNQRVTAQIISLDTSMVYTTSHYYTGNIPGFYNSTNSEDDQESNSEKTKYDNFVEDRAEEIDDEAKSAINSSTDQDLSNIKRNGNRIIFDDVFSIKLPDEIEFTPETDDTSAFLGGFCKEDDDDDPLHLVIHPLDYSPSRTLKEFLDNNMVGHENDGDYIILFEDMNTEIAVSIQTRVSLIDVDFNIILMIRVGEHSYGFQALYGRSGFEIDSVFKQDIKEFSSILDNVELINSKKHIRAEIDDDKLNRIVDRLFGIDKETASSLGEHCTEDTPAVVRDDWVITVPAGYMYSTDEKIVGHRSIVFGLDDGTLNLSAPFDSTINFSVTTPLDRIDDITMPDLPLDHPDMARFLQQAEMFGDICIRRDIDMAIYYSVGNIDPNEDGGTLCISRGCIVTRHNLYYFQMFDCQSTTQNEAESALRKLLLSVKTKDEYESLQQETSENTNSIEELNDQLQSITSQMQSGLSDMQAWAERESIRLKEEERRKEELAEKKLTAKKHRNANEETLLMYITLIIDDANGNSMSDAEFYECYEEDFPALDEDELSELRRKTKEDMLEDPLIYEDDVRALPYEKRYYYAVSNMFNTHYDMGDEDIEKLIIKTVSRWFDDFELSKVTNGIHDLISEKEESLYDDLSGVDENWTSFYTAKDSLYISLFDSDKHEYDPQNKFTVNLGDVCGAVQLATSGFFRMSATLKNYFIHFWAVTAEDIWNAAKNNDVYDRRKNTDVDEAEELAEEAYNKAIELLENMNTDNDSADENDEETIEVYGRDELADTDDEEEAPEDYEDEDFEDDDNEDLIDSEEELDDQNEPVIDHVIENDVLIKYSGNGETFDIPDTVTRVGDGAFKYCKSLTNIVIPDSIVAIDDNAFAYCVGLKEITLSENLQTIGNGAFENCMGLESIVIPSGVSSIGKNAFRYCECLLHISISNNVNTIGENAFSGCNLKSIDVLSDAEKLKKEIAAIDSDISHSRGLLKSSVPSEAELTETRKKSLALHEELRALGFLRFKQKQALREQIADLESRIPILEAKIEAEKKERDSRENKKISELQNKSAVLSKQLEDELSKDQAVLKMVKDAQGAD